MVFGPGPQNVILPVIFNPLRGGGEHLRNKHNGSNLAGTDVGVVFCVQHKTCVQQDTSVTVAVHAAVHCDDADGVL